MLEASMALGVFILLQRIHFPINVLITNHPCQLIKKYICRGAFLAALLLTMSFVCIFK